MGSLNAVIFSIGPIKNNKCVSGNWFTQGFDVCPSPGPATHLCVCTGRMCDRWVQQALQPISSSLGVLEMSRYGPSFPEAPHEVVVWALMPQLL